MNSLFYRKLWVGAAGIGLLIGLILISALAKYFPMISAWIQVQQPPPLTYSQAEIITTKGRFTITFFRDTPRNAMNFATLAADGFYTNTRFHRSVPGLLIQGGDPLTKYENIREQWGKGGPGYTTVDEALRAHSMTRGMVVMANTGPNTNGSQFFILTAPRADFLKGRYTIFARVIAGLEVVDEINSLTVDGTGLPTEPVMIQSINLH